MDENSNPNFQNIWSNGHIPSLDFKNPLDLNFNSIAIENTSTEATNPITESLGGELHIPLNNAIAGILQRLDGNDNNPNRQSLCAD